MDFKNRQDIHRVIVSFYDKLLSDPKISFFFDHIHADDLPHHLDRVADFWNQILFGGDGYQGNPMRPHIILNKRIEFKRDHFDIWLNHFIKTIDDSHQGELAEEMKSRANTIARVMELKMNQLKK